MTETQFKPGNTAAVKHGMYQLERHGTGALPEDMRAREVEVVTNLATRDGALRELERQAALMVLITELGYRWLSEIVEAGDNPWRTGHDRTPEPVLRALAAYSNAATRCLTALAQLRGDKDTLDLATAMTKARQAAEDDANG